MGSYFEVLVLSCLPLVPFVYSLRWRRTPGLHHLLQKPFCDLPRDGPTQRAQLAARQYHVGPSIDRRIDILCEAVVM